MAIQAIIGANGHGKGQLSIYLILDLHKQNDKREKEGKQRRPIYTNIYGINAEGNKPLPDCKPLPAEKIWFGKQDEESKKNIPDGYFVPPIGSIFFYDEAQDFDWIEQKTGSLSKDPMTRSIEEHRHAGLDIFIVTQSLTYIHSHIFELIAPLYYVERPLNAPFTNVFKFNKARLSGGKSQGLPSLKKADDQFQIKIGKKYGQYYKSSAEHNMKFVFPTKLKFILCFLVIILIGIFWKGKDSIFNRSKDVHQVQQQQHSHSEESQKRVVTKHPSFAISDDDGREQLLLEHLPIVVAKTAYNEDIRPAMIIASSKQCRAFNRYGERLRVSQRDCMMMNDDPSYIPRSRSTEDIYQASFSDDLSNQLGNPVSNF